MRPEASPLEEKIVAHLVKKYSVSAHDVTICDVLLMVNGERYGEYSDKHAALHPAVLNADEDRLFRHIAVLADTINQQHLAWHGDFRGLLRPEYRYHITRLCTSEFSFYTRRPLSIESFKKLVLRIELKAKALSENLHLSLSTFAVQLGNKLLNVSLYVECGATPYIHAFSKGVASDVDLQYPGLSFDRQFDDNNIGCGVPFTAIDRVVSLGEKCIISNASVFEISVGDSKFTQCVDVCIDHTNQNSLVILKKNLFDETPEYISRLVNQIVTSASIELEDDATVAGSSNSITHVDQWFSVNKEYFLRGADISRIQKPVFGDPIYLRDCGAFTLDFMRRDLDILRRTHNKKAIENRYGIKIDKNFIDFYLKKSLVEKNWYQAGFILEFAAIDQILDYLPCLIKNANYFSQCAKTLFHIDLFSSEQLSLLILATNIEENIDMVNEIVPVVQGLSSEALCYVAKHANFLNQDILSVLLVYFDRLDEVAFSTVASHLQFPYATLEMTFLIEKILHLPALVVNRIAQQYYSLSDQVINELLVCVSNKLEDTEFNCLIRNVKVFEVKTLSIILQHIQKVDVESFDIIVKHRGKLSANQKAIVMKHPFYSEGIFLTPESAQSILRECRIKFSSKYFSSNFFFRKDKVLNALSIFSVDGDAEKLRDAVKNERIFEPLFSMLSKRGLLNQFGCIRSEALVLRNDHLVSP